MKDLDSGHHSPGEIGKLTAEQKAVVASEYLAGVEPGFLPLPLFKELSRLMVINTVELVLLQPEDDMRVLLTKRPPTDPWWPNKLHIPGSVVLPTDPVMGHDDFTGTLDRIVEDELAGAIEIVGNFNFLETQRRIGPRGHEVTTIHWAEASADEALLPNSATLFTPEDLRPYQPGAIVDGTIETVERAVLAYENA